MLALYCTSSLVCTKRSYALFLLSIPLEGRAAFVPGGGAEESGRAGSVTSLATGRLGLAACLGTGHTASHDRLAALSRDLAGGRSCSPLQVHGWCSSGCDNLGPESLVAHVIQYLVLGVLYLRKEADYGLKEFGKKRVMVLLFPDEVNNISLDT